MQIISNTKCFAGQLKRLKHTSTSLSCDMIFSIFLPPQASTTNPVPVLYWLSGLTCNDENFMQKAGAQRIAAQLGIALVAMDTSPRGEEVADDPGYDLGQGAGFYLNATQQPWAANYQMYDYVTKELPNLIEANFAVSDKKSIAGHSMGGHGALSIGLKNPELYQSVSAFSPIANPINCPWGQKAFTAYLGDNKADWQDYDSCVLLTKASKAIPTLVEQGLDDEFLADQLLLDNLESAAAEANYPLTINKQPGYDHGYYFIASFIEQHLKFHADFLA